MSGGWSFVGSGAGVAEADERELPTVDTGTRVAPHREPKPEPVLSWWERKSREELNAEAEARSLEMLKSPESRLVSGRFNTLTGSAGRPKRTPAVEDVE